MKELLDKLSSYNIFNNLFPGIVFVIITEKITNFNLIIDNNVLGVFVYYFYGLIISRIGSIIIEPILIKFNLVSYCKYSEFIKGSKIDAKIDLFSEINNMYRTIISLLFCVLFLFVLQHVGDKFNSIYKFIPASSVLFLIILFMLSYRKQSNYINHRVNAANASTNENSEEPSK